MPPPPTTPSPRRFFKKPQAPRPALIGSSFLSKSHEASAPRQFAPPPRFQTTSSSVSKDDDVLSPSQTSPLVRRPKATQPHRVGFDDVEGSSPPVQHHAGSGNVGDRTFEGVERDGAGEGQVTNYVDEDDEDEMLLDMLENSPSRRRGRLAKRRRLTPPPEDVDFNASISVKGDKIINVSDDEDDYGPELESHLQIEHDDPECESSHTRPSFLNPSKLLTQHARNHSQALGAGQSGASFILRPVTRSSPPPSPNIPQIFSPHRRGARYVPGGLAESVRDSILQFAASSAEAKRARLLRFDSVRRDKKLLLAREAVSAVDHEGSGRLWLLVGGDVEQARMAQEKISSGEEKSMAVLEPTWSVALAPEGEVDRGRCWVAIEWGVFGDPGFTRPELERKCVRLGF